MLERRAYGERPRDPSEAGDSDQSKKVKTPDLYLKNRMQPRVPGRIVPEPGGRPMGTILLIILILLLIGALPRWPYSTGWGYYPVGGLGLLLIIILILVLLGRI
jgi:Protein of unknown function (DUF3309)